MGNIYLKILKRKLRIVENFHIFKLFFFNHVCVYVYVIIINNQFK